MFLCSDIYEIGIINTSLSIFEIGILKIHILSFSDHLESKIKSNPSTKTDKLILDMAPIDIGQESDNDIQISKKKKHKSKSEV